MIGGILLIACIALFAWFSYRHKPLETRVLKNIPLIDWMYILILPIFLYIAVLLIVKSVLARESIGQTRMDTFELLAIGAFFLVYAFVGNSIHFVSKVLSRYIKPSKNSISYQVNEIFHGRLSHYMLLISGLMVFFVLGFLEMNYPTIAIADSMQLLIVSASMLSGLAFSKSVFYTNAWFGGHNKPLFFIVGFLETILFATFRSYKLLFSHYPVNLFVNSFYLSILLIFVARQFLIFSRLGTKRRLQFLAKMLSI